MHIHSDTKTNTHTMTHTGALDLIYTDIHTDVHIEVHCGKRKFGLAFVNGREKKKEREREEKRETKRGAKEREGDLCHPVWRLRRGNLNFTKKGQRAVASSPRTPPLPPLSLPPPTESLQKHLKKHTHTSTTQKNKLPQSTLLLSG